MRLRWAVIVVGFIAAVWVLGIFVFGDSACRTWQQGYTIVYEDFMRRNAPLIERDVVEETERRLGPRPKDCAIPQPLDE